MSDEKRRVSRYFYWAELACHCDSPTCRGVVPSARLLDRLDQLREAWGRPLFPTSGVRCEEHNAKVGGASGSLHVKGLAVDFYFPDDATKDEFVRVAERVGFGGIGVGVKGVGKVHLDVRRRFGMPPARWVYTK